MRRRAPHLVTTAAHAVAKAVREQTGYTRVSRRRLDGITVSCPWCGRAMRHERDRQHRRQNRRAWETSGYFVCESHWHQMWMDRLSRKRWDRRFKQRASVPGVARNMWYMPKPPPKRREQRAAMFGQPKRGAK